MNENLKLFTTFFKIGLVTFGGGYAMLPIIEREVVEKHRWLDETEFLNMIAVSESTPGAIAVSMAAFVGRKRKGVLGGIIATLGIVLPSLIIIIAISFFIERFLENEFVRLAFKGIKGCIGVLIFNAGLKLFKHCHKGIFFLFMLGATFLISLFLTAVPAFLLIFVGAILAIFYFLIMAKLFRKQVDEI
ncbi:MAG: chromate transporter [Erysipelotrichales bacterium]|nr:chromate transporter [Erysipelotrichales bacterium]